MASIMTLKFGTYPDVFSPDRFADWEGSPFGFIPQGGGDYLMGHRCAGEWVTVEVMKVNSLLSSESNEL